MKYRLVTLMDFHANQYHLQIDVAKDVRSLLANSVDTFMGGCYSG